MKIFLKNKHGKPNYKPKDDLEMRHCPDFNQGFPVYKTGALTTTPQSQG